MTGQHNTIFTTERSMSATRIFTSPPYTGSSADAELVQRESHVTISAAYYADREETLDLAAAASFTPGELSSVEIARLGSVICDLDTLVVVRDFDLASDYHSYRALQHEMQIQINALIEGRAAKHAELVEARGKLLEQALKIERLHAEIALGESLRLSALQDAYDHQVRAIQLSLEMRTLRLQSHRAQAYAPGVDDPSIEVTA